VGTPLDEVERIMITRTLRKTENNKTRAAELLRISLKTLHNKLRLYRERGVIEDERLPVYGVREQNSGELQ
jgi:DNA-binding NtrC family response regulator